ncbi:MAG: hypothetical protein IJT42_08445 [Treponema sp.]|nr:hypothetical protein [Treponema sp.]
MKILGLSSKDAETELKAMFMKQSAPVKEDETKDFDLSTLVNEALKK